MNIYNKCNVHVFVFLVVYTKITLSLCLSVLTGKLINNIQIQREKYKEKFCSWFCFNRIKIYLKFFFAFERPKE